MARERRFCLPPLEDGRSRSHFTICHPGPCGSCKTTDLRYSWRSAVTGLMRMARIAGTQQATAAIARIIRNTVAYVIGSVGWTPYKICCNSRPTRRARPSPIAVPEPMRSSARRGSVASFGLEQGFKERASFPGTLGSHFEEFVDEPILTPDATPAQPPHLALPNYVHRLIALNRSSRSGCCSVQFPVDCAEATGRNQKILKERICTSARRSAGLLTTGWPCSSGSPDESASPPAS